MSKRILFIGGGEAMARAVAAAAELGYRTVALDNDPQSPVAACAHETLAGDTNDPTEVVRLARAAKVDGIYPTVEPAAVPAALAAAAVNLPALSPHCVSLMRDKPALRQALAARGIHQPAFCSAASEDEARAAAQTIGLPAVLKAADSPGACCVRRVDQLEDISLAFIQARRESPRGIVMVESFLQGRHLTVEGAVQCGAFRPIAAVGMIPAEGPGCYTQAVYAPVEQDVLRDLASAAGEVAAALRITCGFISAHFVRTSKANFLLDLHAHPAHLRLPMDLMGLVNEIDSVGGVLSTCTGDTPRAGVVKHPERCAAITWMPTHSGIVTSVEGLREGASLPGVVEIKVNAKLGQTMGHVLDKASRDRVGYVVTTGKSAGEALDRGKHACEVARIITSPTLG